MDENPPSSEGYREAVASDILDMVKIHQAAFPEYFMTLLGPKFLQNYYDLVINFPGRICYVKEGKEGIEGFVAGFLSPSIFYSEIKKYRFKFLISIIFQIIRHPTYFLRLYASYTEADRSIESYDLDVCELSSIAVLPEIKGKGVGKGLIKAFVGAVKGNAKIIVLTTDAKNNEYTNEFYKNLGFELKCTYYRSKNRPMNKYSLVV